MKSRLLYGLRTSHPQNALLVKIGEKIHKFIKKIIALNGFDDYYNKFGYKDLDKKVAKMITLN